MMSEERTIKATMFLACIAGLFLTACEKSGISQGLEVHTGEVDLDEVEMPDGFVEMRNVAERAISELEISNVGLASAMETLSMANDMIDRRDAIIADLLADCRPGFNERLETRYYSMDENGVPREVPEEEYFEGLRNPIETHYGLMDDDGVMRRVTREEYLERLGGAREPNHAE